MVDFLRVTNQVNSKQMPIASGARNYSSSPVSFAGNQSSAPLQDTVEISTKPKKKKRSLWKKFAIGLGSTVGAIIVLALAYAKHQSVKLNKLYKEKLVLSNLPKKIDFKPAKTVEEGIKFSKEVLGIKEVSNDFTLEAINWANEGLVNVSNAYEGQLFMPHKMHYGSKILSDSNIAGVVRDVNLKSFGDLIINPRFFDDKFLDDSIRKMYANVLGKGSKSDKLLRITPNREDMRLLERFGQNPKSLSTMEKRQLWQNGRLGINRADALTDECPLELVKMLNKELVKKGQPSVNTEELSQKSLSEIKAKVEKMLKAYKKCTGESFRIYSEQVNPFRTIYHEMGHLQDYALNLKNLDTVKWELNLKDLWRQIREAHKRGEKYIDRSGVQEVDNRWGTRKLFNNLMKKNSKLFKKLYPDAYEFFNNEKIQQAAGEVSLYAQTGIGEFVAEVHAGLIGGKHYSDEVMKLYKKYNGPMPKRL